MGRYCGDLTLAATIAGGCEFVVVPEVEFSREDLVNEIKAGIAKGKKHAIVAITEHMCDVDELAHFIEKGSVVKPAQLCWATSSAVVLRCLTTVFWLPVWALTLSICCWQVTAVVV